MTSMGFEEYENQTTNHINFVKNLNKISVFKATGNDILLSFESFNTVLPNSKESRIRIHSTKSSGDYPLLAPITVFQPPPTPPHPPYECSTFIQLVRYFSRLCENRKILPIS